MSENPLYYDVLILGGGPAGISTAFWCSELGLNSLLIDGNTVLGGQLLHVFNPIENYLGLRASNGRELRDAFVQNIKNKNLGVLTGKEIVAVDLVSRSIILNDDTTLSGRAIVIATGISRRRLGVTGESEFEGRGILKSGAGEKDSVNGKSVLIVGGGDAALENACILGAIAKKVYIAHRGASFTARPDFIISAAEMPNIETLYETTVESIQGIEVVTSVTLNRRLSDRSIDLPIDKILIRIGSEPNTQLVRGQLDLDDRGFIRVDAYCLTDLPGVFAAGDVANSVSPTISTAVGMGSTVAKSIFKSLKSPA